MYFCETKDLMKWINKIWYIHTMKYYSDVKKEWNINSVTT